MELQLGEVLQHGAPLLLHCAVVGRRFRRRRRPQLWMRERNWQRGCEWFFDVSHGQARHAATLLPLPTHHSDRSSAVARQGHSSPHSRQGRRAQGGEGSAGFAGAMAESVEGAPITTSAVLMSASKHITSKCGAQNRAFLDCKRSDPNPEKCLQQGQNVTRCVISLLRELNTKCPKAMESYTKCMDYYSNEFELCRKEQREFEASCPL